MAAAPGTKVARRLHPDTREWFAVVEGEVRVEIEGQAPFTATRGSLVNIPRQTIYALESDRRHTEPALSRQRRAGEDAVSARAAETAGAVRAGGIVVGSRDAQPDRRTVRSIQPAAPEHPRGRREEREVRRRAIRARRQVGDARDLRPREEPAAARSRTTRGISTPRAPSSGSSSPARSATRSRDSSRSSPARATSSTCPPARGTRRGTPVRIRRAACRSPNTSATPCCSNHGSDRLPADRPARHHLGRVVSVHRGRPRRRVAERRRIRSHPGRLSTLSLVPAVRRPIASRDRGRVALLGIVWMAFPADDVSVRRTARLVGAGRDAEWRSAAVRRGGGERVARRAPAPAVLRGLGIGVVGTILSRFRA